MSAVLPRRIVLDRQPLEIAHFYLQVDIRGRAQCRTFVLGEASPDPASLAGSASIAGWLQLHLANQVI